MKTFTVVIRVSVDAQNMTSLGKKAAAVKKAAARLSNGNMEMSVERLEPRKAKGVEIFERTTTKL